MRADRADGTAEPTTGEGPAAATPSDPAPGCGRGPGGSADRHCGGRRHAERCCGSPAEAPASKYTAPSGFPRADSRRARAVLGFESSVATKISRGDVRPRLRTVEQSPSGHHAWPRYDTARPPITRAWGRLSTVDVANGVASVRLAPAPHGTYVVTSAIGNFLVGTRRSRWLVISLPGD